LTFDKSIRVRLVERQGECQGRTAPAIYDRDERNVMTSSRTRFLHVANGGATTGVITAAGLPGELSVWADPLYEGPVPALGDDELLQVRADFLAGEEHPQAEVAGELGRWRSVIAEGAYDELVLWYEHDLFDQLNLIQLLSWIRHHGRVTQPVSLICIGAFPGRPHFKGLGELTPGELAPLLNTRQPVAAAQFDVAERAWEAYRAPTPEALEGLLQSDTSAMPFLASAVRRFLEEYPWTTDGLSRFERRLLELATGGPMPLASAFPRMQDGETAYYMADSSLHDLANSLATTSPALLTVERPETSATPRLLDAVVTLTDPGRAVLDGTQDRVTLCGIDKWLGGVHLTTGDAIWRWSAERGQVLRPYSR
jgi:hypothetical protein